MTRHAYVNGRYVPHQDAAVHIEDRGYQFADGVYEVVLIHEGRLLDEEPHLDRLERSLRELGIASPMSRPALRQVIRALLRRNRLTQGLLYIQVTRGVAPRDHKFPPAGVAPALVLMTKRLQAPPANAPGVAVVTTPEIRWRRCDIKSIALLPNVLAKQRAVTAGAYEAWFVDAEGAITEGSATNAWIVTADGALVTRQIDAAILSGITRRTVIALAEQAGLRLEQRAFRLAEASAAKEAFITSASSFVLPVTTIDGTAVGDGKVGSFTATLRAAYFDYAARQPVVG